MIIVFDTETKRFRPGMMAPPIVCVQWCIDGGAAQLMTRRGEFTNGTAFGGPFPGNTFSSLLRYWLESGALLVGHNVAYDLACFAAEDPEIVPLIFRAYRENRVTDTMWRQKLADIGEGKYRGFFKGPVWIPIEYNLGNVAGRYGFKVDKDDPWRLHYDLLADVPLAEWAAFRAEVPDLRKGAPAGATVTLRGEDAIAYALGDPAATWAAYVGQCERYGEQPGARSASPHAPLLVDQFFQARKFWALHLAAVWGLRTSLRGVMSLEKGAIENLERLQDLLMNPGDGPALVRPDGSRDTKAAKERMRKACAEAGVPLRLTKAGDVCLDKDACEGSGDPLLEAYAEFSGYKKVLSNDVEALKLGVVHPIHTHFDICDTSRVSSAKPNVMNPRRLAGVRECYVPRGYAA